MERFIDHLLEARRNPGMNPKVSAFEYIQQHGDNQPVFPGTYTTNSFVSFTAIDKLGINPRSKYQTPFGIYSYPTDYILQQISPQTGDLGTLPFAGKQPYVNIFSIKPTSKIIFASTLKSPEVEKYFKATAEYYASHYPEVQWKLRVDIVERFINDSSNKATFSNWAMGRLWYVTRETSFQLSIDKNRRNHPLIWNKLFRAIGIDGAVDDKGIGIIHTSEPSQAVFFSKAVVDKVTRTPNKWSAESKIQGGEIALATAQVARAKKAFDTMSQKEQLEYVTSHLGGNEWKKGIAPITVKSLTPEFAVALIKAVPTETEWAHKLSTFIFYFTYDSTTNNWRKNNSLLKVGRNKAWVDKFFSLIFNDIIRANEPRANDPGYVLSRLTTVMKFEEKHYLQLLMKLPGIARSIPAEAATESLIRALYKKYGEKVYSMFTSSPAQGNVYKILDNIEAGK